MSDIPIRTFGRTRSRTLSAAQAERVERTLPGLSTPATPFDPALLEPHAAEVWLEAGFGSGEHLIAQAGRRRDVLFLGAEPFLNGLAAALTGIEAAGLSNVRIHHGDVRDLMALLPAQCLTRLIVLFPDPWPKRRHLKRRLINRPFVEEAARLLSPNGLFRFATDWADYADAALRLFLQSPAFAWTADRANDWRLPPVGHTPTRYEQKRLGDTAPIWLEFRRL